MRNQERGHDLRHGAGPLEQLAARDLLPVDGAAADLTLPSPE